MPDQKQSFVCPLVMAGILDSKLRKFLHNPNKILKPYIRKNMTILDIGCGPGIFSIEAAKLLEGTGKVISVDMQQGMLDMIQNKIKGEPFKKTIILHKCTQNGLNLKENVDLVLLIYMVHEVPDKERFFNEIVPLVNKNGIILYIEHSLVSKRAYNKISEIIKAKGFEEHETLKLPLSRGVVLRKL
jgi:ubiquinone/menaquinone biosynthesis C-methylase UbiE